MLSSDINKSAASTLFLSRWRGGDCGRRMLQIYSLLEWGLKRCFIYGCVGRIHAVH